MKTTLKCFFYVVIKCETFKLEIIHQKQASYGIQSVQLKVNQVQNSTKLDSEATKEFYETINKYIDQKLSEKDSQKDLVKENEADKD